MTSDGAAATAINPRERLDAERVAIVARIQAIESRIAELSGTLRIRLPGTLARQLAEERAALIKEKTLHAAARLSVIRDEIKAINIAEHRRKIEHSIRARLALNGRDESSLVNLTPADAFHAGYQLLVQLRRDRRVEYTDEEMFVVSAMDEALRTLGLR